MKRLLFLLVAGTVGFGSARGDLAQELTALRESANQRTTPLTGATPLAPSEATLRSEEHARRLSAQALALYEANSSDPLRWEAALIALKTMRAFITELKPGYDEAIAARDAARIQSLIVRDEAARSAWETRLDGIEQQMLAAPDVSGKILAEGYANAIYRITLRRGVNASARWKRCQPLLVTMLQRVDDGAQLTRALEMASRFAATTDQVGWSEILRVASQSSVAGVSSWATGKANVEAAKVQSIDIRFTALDGREVDFKKLRGKVVLLDFWAKWCGPCKAELPNILRVYQAYHERGFEVVAVSLDGEKDRAALRDYIREHNLPWPQHYDGKYWQNEFGTLFGIRAIPAMFLIDQAGRIVSTDARGPKLESEVRRLLRLDDGSVVTNAPAVSPPGALAAPAEPAKDSDSPPVSLAAAGTVAPDFVSYDASGTAVRVSDYRGKVVILDFWATWCGPCIASMPHTQAVAQRYADQGVVVLAVCTGDRRKRFEDWVKLKQSNYPALRFTFDPHEQGTAAYSQRASWALYGVPAIPTQFVIDRQGRIAGSVTGYIPGDSSLERALGNAGIVLERGKTLAPADVASAAKAQGGKGTRLMQASGSGDSPTNPATARRVAPPFSEKVAKVNAGDTVADVEFLDATGQPRKLSDYRGRPTVVFFSSAEMIPDDYLNRIVTTFGAANVQVLAIVTRDTPAAFAAWWDLHRTRGHRFVVALDPVPITDPRNGVVNRIFQFGAPTPFSLVLDREGRFLGTFPWKLPQGQQGLAELLRRAGVPPPPGEGLKNDPSP